MNRAIEALEITRRYLRLRQPVTVQIDGLLVTRGEILDMIAEVLNTHAGRVEMSAQKEESANGTKSSSR